MAVFRRKPRNDRFLTIELNARLQPLDLSHHFEDPLVAHLAAFGLAAEVTGGSTEVADDGEPLRSDIEVLVTSGDPMPVVGSIAIFLMQIGAPKGSRLLDTGTLVTELGTHEGIGLYLDGTAPPDEVAGRIGDALGDAGRVLSSWEGPRETALYLYGPSATTMRERLAPLLEAQPLAQRCRLVSLT